MSNWGWHDGEPLTTRRAWITLLTLCGVFLLWYHFIADEEQKANSSGLLVPSGEARP
ncbi:hypothetical protein [Sphingomicrobium arenosum]|uniref:hypothetical protein n=1 Tax=Sphingomicrobium arenosum TaxID=2233861 RepID=UPI002240EC4A|nr:hypothetical protein [Sphingomicrobium arenosum]